MKLPHRRQFLHLAAGAAALRQLRGSGSLALRIEVPAQPLPAFDVVVLPHLVDGRVERMVSTLVQVLR